MLLPSPLMFIVGCFGTSHRTAIAFVLLIGFFVTFMEMNRLDQMRSILGVAIPHEQLPMLAFTTFALSAVSAYGGYWLGRLCRWVWHRFRPARQS